MASDGGVLDTGLVLGLGCSSASAGHQHRPASNSAHPKLHHTDNSLALTLSRGTFEKPGGSDRRRDDCLYRQDSAASSFSNVKRERGTGSSEEVEIGRAISSTLSDEDDDGSNGRKKLRLSKAQSAILEESFKLHSTLSPKQKQDLANDLKLRARQVEVWFQNRRARTKLKQTEVDCEFLKQCCETLKDENMRLQKELKALKLAQPLYMRLPPAALTMCPFCERICGGDSDSAAPKSTAAALAMAPNQHFCNSFTNSSAAC